MRRDRVSAMADPDFIDTSYFLQAPDQSQPQQQPQQQQGPELMPPQQQDLVAAAAAAHAAEQAQQQQQYHAGGHDHDPGECDLNGSISSFFWPLGRGMPSLVVPAAAAVHVAWPAQQHLLRRRL